MRQTDALQYLPRRRLNPLLEVECASEHCTKKFTLSVGVAFPACFDNVVTMAFFCSEACYLAAIPPDACPRA
jgi:hypothetical protein